MKSFSLTNSQKVAVMIALPVFLSLGLSGCYKDPNFSNTPVISFKEIKKVTVTDALGNPGVDSVIITIHFEDGDGNLGLTQAEVNADPWKGKNNFEVKSFVKQGTQFVPLTDILNKEVDNSGNFFPLNPSEKSGPIEGTLDYSIKFYRVTTAKDTVQFRIRIWDKDLNASNWAETEPIVVNSQK
jgi:hypothetical protein